MHATAATPRYTASQLIVLAGDDLHRSGVSEFTEWELTIAAWKRSPRVFGMRGYASLHPDHKRVSMEIMGRKPHNPLLQGLMEKVRPNVYKLTTLGRAEAARLRDNKWSPYDLVRPFVHHPVFRGWVEDPDTPQEFDLAIEFLAGWSIDQIKESVRSAFGWCNSNDVAYLIKDPGSSVDPPIHFRDLADLMNFLQAITYRFSQFGETRD